MNKLLILDRAKRFLGAMVLMASLAFSHFISARTIVIGDSGDYPTLRAAASGIRPGDTLVLQSQFFDDGAQFLSEWTGTASDPIVIRAEREHEAIFRGGSAAIHLIKCHYVVIEGLIFEGQTGNGVNIDDGGDYDIPSKHITVRNCIFREMNTRGNNDFLKMSGIDSFLVEGCVFVNGSRGGSGIDFVGCHYGVVRGCSFDNAGSSGVQCKGGSLRIRVEKNVFKNISQRAINLGGSTGLEYFRPPLPNPIVDAYEAADLEVFSNIFIGSLAPIAYVGSVGVKVYNNTFYEPEKWVIRILQENTTQGFLPCSNNEFRNNIIYLERDKTEVNIGPNTNAGTFIFSNNLWFNAQDSRWSPSLPVRDRDQIIANPLFTDLANEDLSIPPGSPAVGAGFIFDEPATDFTGKAYYSPPSIGAYEGYETTTSLKEDAGVSSVVVYPNPTSNTSIIRGDFTDASLQVFDARGVLIVRSEGISFLNEIDLSREASGIYFIHLRQGDHFIIKKLVKW